jgi:hypothetical protein
MSTVRIISFLCCLLTRRSASQAADLPLHGQRRRHRNPLPSCVPRCGCSNLLQVSLQLSSDSSFFAQVVTYHLLKNANYTGASRSEPPMSADSGKDPQDCKVTLEHLRSFVVETSSFCFCLSATAFLFTFSSGPPTVSLTFAPPQGQPWLEQFYFQRAVMDEAHEGLNDHKIRGTGLLADSVVCCPLELFFSLYSFSSDSVSHRRDAVLSFVLFGRLPFEHRYTSQLSLVPLWDALPKRTFAEFRRRVPSRAGKSPPTPPP